jgi:protein-S-isoprenylcysteine O-methyltransferase Ste14
LLWLAVTLFYVFDARSVTWFGYIALLDNDVVNGVGIASSIVGLILGIIGEVTMGESFCIALPRTKTGLITRGLYHYSRNPVVLGTILLVLGTFLIAPSFLAFLALVVNIIGYEMKTRAEEEYLRRVHGTEYEAYCVRTGRYLPMVRRREGE